MFTPGLAERRAEVADHAGRVVVLEDDDVPLGHRLEPELVHAHDALLAAAEHGAGDDRAAVVAAQLDREQGWRSRATPRCAPRAPRGRAPSRAPARDTSFTGSSTTCCRSPFSTCATIGRSGTVGELAGELDAHLAHGARRELRRERAEPLGEGEVAARAAPASPAGAPAGSPRSSRRRATRNAASCSAIATATAACASSVDAPRCGVQTTLSSLKQRVIGGRRLLLEHVERRAAEVARRERLRERALVDDPAARAVHEERALLHLARAVCAFTRFRVCSVSGTCSETTSACAQSSSSATSSTPSRAAASGEMNGS